MRLSPMNRSGRNRPFAGLTLGCLSMALIAGSVSPAEAKTKVEDPQGLVTIEGGCDTSGHNYAWSVANNHTSPIVEIEFPHYRADSFDAPEGWRKETTRLVNLGVKDEPGVCIARVEADRVGIVRGAEREFGMRTASPRPAIGTGTVKVTFADGKVIEIAGVELPEAPDKWAKRVPLIGVAIIFALWVGIRTIRQRRRPGQDAANDSAPSATSPTDEI